MLPMLSMAKQDNMKWVFSSGKNQHCQIKCIVSVLAPLQNVLKDSIQVLFGEKNIMKIHFSDKISFQVPQ